MFGQVYINDSDQIYSVTIPFLFFQLTWNKAKESCIDSSLINKRKIVAQKKQACTWLNKNHIYKSQLPTLFVLVISLNRNNNSHQENLFPENIHL